MLCGNEKTSRTSIICDYHQSFVYAPMYMDIWPCSISFTTSCRLGEAMRLTTTICLYASHWKQRSPVWQLCRNWWHCKLSLRQNCQIQGLFVFSGPFHVFVVGVPLNNMQKPDDFTAAIIYTLSPNEALMSNQYKAFGFTLSIPDSNIPFAPWRAQVCGSYGPHLGCH